MKHARRYLVAIFFAAATAAFVLLYPRAQSQPEQPGPEPLEERVQEEPLQTEEVLVPWPSPPSASPLTSEPPPVIVEPEEPNSAFLFREINQWRNDLGLKSVILDDTLTALAQLHASDMARRSYLEHVTPEGVTFEMRINASGYSYNTAAENLGFASHINLIVPNWVRSPAHRANMENSDFRAIGVATAPGKWDGIDVMYAATVYAVPR